MTLSIPSLLLTPIELTPREISADIDAIFSNSGKKRTRCAFKVMDTVLVGDGYFARHGILIFHRKSVFSYAEIPFTQLKLLVSEKCNSGTY